MTAKIEFEPLPLDGALTVTPACYGDARGHFSETYNRDALAGIGITVDFMQDNQSWSARAGTLRGLHCQLPPHGQAKLVRVLRGRVLDVLVDARRGSASYGQHCTLELDAQGGRQVFVPHGFLHGFLTLEDDCLVSYKVDAPYAPAHDRSVAWNDDALGIDWGIDADRVILSDKDRQALGWADFASPFTLEPVS